MQENTSKLVSFDIPMQENTSKLASFDIPLQENAIKLGPFDIPMQENMSKLVSEPAQMRDKFWHDVNALGCHQKTKPCNNNRHLSKSAISNNCADTK